MTAEVFGADVEQMLAPALQSGDVVVMDNGATIVDLGRARSTAALTFYSYRIKQKMSCPRGGLPEAS
jgi:DNA helicase TIP49 (TBP-interacting protein)